MDFIEVRNPATREVVGKVHSSDANDCAVAISRAREAQKRWASRRFSERSAIIRRFHDLVLDRSDRILDVIQSETGKTRRDAFGEIVSVAGTARYYLAHGGRHLSDQHRDPAVPGITSAEIVYKPHGVVGLITPWNYPFLLAIGDAIPALLAGNAVVVKPSELTPLSADLARELFLEAGLDVGLLTMLHGSGDSGAELVRHVDYVGFTGGTATGRKVAVAAADRLIPFSLEMGGKNPMIVLKGAPLDDAVSGLIVGAFANSGQTCIAVERVFVEETVFEEFSQKIADKTAALKLGWSKGWELDMGSLISEEHTEKVMDHIDQAREAGAKVLTGGHRRSDLGKTFVAPTILTDVTESMLVSRDETFGPVVSLYPVRSAEEAIQCANDSEFGLNASVWTGDSARSRVIARRLESGSTVINSTLLIYNSFDVPMGGVKHSGIGRRHGEQGILRYTQAQSIVSSISSGGGYDAILGQMNRPSRVKSLLNVLRLWRRMP